MTIESRNDEKKWEDFSKVDVFFIKSQIGQSHEANRSVKSINLNNSHHRDTKYTKVL